MDIIARTKQATDQLFDAMMEGKGMSIDSGDKPGECTSTPTGAKCEFKMYTDVDSGPRQRGVIGGGVRPLGQLVYTVVVTGEWVPFDE